VVSGVKRAERYMLEPSRDAVVRRRVKDTMAYSKTNLRGKKTKLWIDGAFY